TFLAVLVVGRVHVDLVAVDDRVGIGGEDLGDERVVSFGGLLRHTGRGGHASRALVAARAAAGTTRRLSATARRPATRRIRSAGSRLGATGGDRASDPDRRASYASPRRSAAARRRSAAAPRVRRSARTSQVI